ncbi:MAG: FeoA domain-containing protein [Thermodesulfobacteriota bacterium]|nr:FeoA domain-containing protein [Thermodesulfobacteriota bacterium]
MGSRRKQTPWKIGRAITMVLSNVDTEKEVTLIAITGGRGIRSKLYSMGLVPEVRLRVLNRNGTGPGITVITGIQ